MLWVVTFSVFLTSLTSSCVVWVNPSAAPKPSSVAHSQMFFMIGLASLKFAPARGASDTHPCSSGDYCILLQAGQNGNPGLTHTYAHGGRYDQTLTYRTCASLCNQPCRARHRALADVQG